MIDLHTHILPGVDDGAPDLQAALAMVEIAAESGVSAITVTPHSNMPGYFENHWGPELRQKVEDFISALRWAGAAVSLYTGMEIFGTPDTPALLRQGRLMTLNGSRYPLIEFPFEGYAAQATDILRRVAALGYRPVVAHPERYRYAQEDPALLDRWLGLGCLLQVNRGSLFGRFGRASEALAHGMLRRGQVCVVASDAHSPATRTPWLRDAWELICKEYSAGTARLLLEDNPRRILADQAPVPAGFDKGECM